MAHIAIVGAGEFGQALGVLLKKADHSLAYWDVDTSKTGHDRPLNDVLMAADVVFFAVPSWCLRDALQAAFLACKNGAILVSVAKGLEKGTHATSEDVFSAEIGNQFPVVYLSGPMLAEEIMEHKPTGAVLASTDGNAAVRVADIFCKTGLRTTTTSDVRGLVLCGVLKNVYTIGLGMASALELGDNARGYLIAQSLREMRQMIEQLGGETETLCGPAGIGDFVATSAGLYSRNFTFGYTFVKSPEKCAAAEGAASYQQLQALISYERGQYPVLDGIIEVLEGRQEPKAFFHEYFTA